MPHPVSTQEIALASPIHRYQATCVNLHLVHESPRLVHSLCFLPISVAEISRFSQMPSTRSYHRVPRHPAQRGRCTGTRGFEVLVERQREWPIEAQARFALVVHALPAPAVPRRSQRQFWPWEGANAKDHLRRPLTREWARSARLGGRPHPAALGETRAAQRGGKGGERGKGRKGPNPAPGQNSAVRLLRRVGRKGVPQSPRERPP